MEFCKDVILKKWTFGKMKIGIMETWKKGNLKNRKMEIWKNRYWEKWKF